MGKSHGGKGAMRKNTDVQQAITLLRQGLDMLAAAVDETAPAKATKATKTQPKAVALGTFTSAKALRAAHPKAALGSTATVVSSAGLGTFQYVVKSKTSDGTLYWGTQS